jgi:Arc/MetJ-type ribon-helix-helix transcriptional regulator
MRQKRRREENNMRITTINLPERYIDAIEELTERGSFPNRSEAVRVALKEFLADELQLYQDLDDENLYQILEKEATN